VQMMAQSQQGGAPGQAVAPGGGGPPAQGAPQAGGGGNVAAEIIQALQSLPPPVLQAIGNALAQGIPPAQIFQQMLAAQKGSAA
jgi:hypothetical protein